MPRKCSATNRIITAKDHTSVQISIAKVDEQVGGNDELKRMLEGLEERYDSYMAGSTLATPIIHTGDLPSADELAAESGQELPPLPPIPVQLEPSDGTVRRTARPAGEWCREHGVTPPPGSFESSNAGLAPGA